MFSKSISWAFCLGAILPACKVAAADNVVFLNNPSPQDVQKMGNYVVKETTKPFFSGLVLFAANINADASGAPELYYNPEMKAVLDDNISIVRALQKKGIKVQIAYLGNHQKAGWSCTMTADAAKKLARAMVTDVVKYQLDGINVDDEYSLCSGNTTSFYNVLAAIKFDPRFNGKILSKALWSDSRYFSGVDSVAKLVEQGYEMTYDGKSSRLQSYNAYGMDKKSLYLGIDPIRTPVKKVEKTDNPVSDVVKSVIGDGYAGVMIWAPNGSLRASTDAVAYYTKIIREENKSSESVEYKTP